MNDISFWTRKAGFSFDDNMMGFTAVRVNSLVDLGTPSEASLNKIIELIYFLRANLIRLEKEKRPAQKARFQIAIAANRIDEGKAHEYIK